MKTWIANEPMPLFDLMASIEARDKGVSQAAANKASLLKYARQIAVEVAKRKGEISMDDVAAALHEKGISVFALGSSAGALFQKKDWEWTGRFTKSVRVHSHGNLLRCWVLREKINGNS